MAKFFLLNGFSGKLVFHGFKKLGHVGVYWLYFFIFTYINLIRMAAINALLTFFKKIDRVTLGFRDLEMEKEFLNFYRLDILVNMRVSIIFSMIIYGLFSVLDYLLVPQLFEVFFRIRFIYVLPLAFLILLFFQIKILLQYAQLLVSLLIILSGMGIVAMVVLGGESLLQYYYVGLILVLIFNYDLIKLRFIYATFSGWVIVLAYGLVCYYSDISSLTVALSSFFLVSANLFGMISAYYFELITRKNFYTNKLLRQEQLKTVEINKTLEIKVEERSSSLKQLNTNLKQAEAKFRSMVERSNDMVWTTDVSDQVTFVNHQFETLMNMSLLDAFKIRFQDVIHPTSIQEYKDTVYALKTGSGVDYTIRVISPDGKEMLWQIHAASLSHENVFSGVVHFGMDITDAHRNELKRKIIHNIAEKINSPINPKDLFGFVYAEIKKVLSLSNFEVALVNEEDSGFNCTFSENVIESIHEEVYKESLLNHIVGNESAFLGNAQTLISGQIQVEGYYTQFADCIGVPLKISEKVVGAILLIHHSNERVYDQEDLEMMEVITYYISQLLNRQKTADQLLEALKQASESDRLKSAFLSTMSHELRTPLNAIIGFSGLITNHTSTEEALEYANIINQSGNNLLKIVKDILNITLLESGEITQNIEVFEMKALIDELKEMVVIEQRELAKNEILFYWDQLDNFMHYQLKCDKKILKQVLGNLLKNALKFTLEGSISVSCEIVQENNQSFFRFCVSDTGIGVGKDQQEFIFNLFRQVDDSYTRRFGGVGVGLSVAARLVTLIGGRIWLESELDKGSSFYFTVPNFIEQEMDSTWISPEDIAEDHLSKDRIKLILIVDDVESSYMLLSLMLIKLSYSTLWAKSGAEAIEICRHNQSIGLVLMDLKMPDMNGYEASRLIKQDRPALPIIAQTAYAIRGDREKALASGCDEYLIKPINQNMLFDVVNQYV